MRISKVIFLLGLILSLTTGCSNAGMGAKGKSHRVSSQKNTGDTSVTEDVAEVTAEQENAPVKEGTVVNDDRSVESTQAASRRQGQTVQPVIIVEDKSGSTSTQVSDIESIQVTSRKKEGAVTQNTTQTSRPTVTKPSEPLPKPLPPPSSKSAPSAQQTQVGAKQTAPTATTTASSVRSPNKPLPVFLSYADQTEKYESDRSQDLVVDMLRRTEILSLGARATSIPDEAFETATRVSTFDGAGVWLPNSLVNKVVTPRSANESDSFYPCDLNAVSACVVFVKNINEKGEVITKVFSLGTVNPAEKSKPVELAKYTYLTSSDENLKRRLSDFFKSKSEGIFVYSSAPTRLASIAAFKGLVSTEEAVQLVSEGESPEAQAALDAQIKLITDASEKAAISKEIEDAVQQQTVKATTNNGAKSGFNKCMIKSAESDERPGHGMKTVRRIVILDFVNIASVVTNKGELPYRIGKGHLNCKLFNGDVQSVAIMIKEYISPLTVGLALTKNRQTLKASGVGFANGARDILEIKDYHFIADFNVTALGSLSLTPVAFSSNHPNASILAGVVGYADEIDWPGVRVTIGGKYEITIDPDET